MSKKRNWWQKFLDWFKGATVTPTPQPPVKPPVVTPPLPLPVDPPFVQPTAPWPEFRKGITKRLAKVTHNFSSLFWTSAGVRACAYENRHEDGRDDSYIIDPTISAPDPRTGQHVMTGKRIYSETCETFGEPVAVGGVLRIPQEGKDQKVNVYDPITGIVTQGIRQAHKIALCGVVLNGVPMVFSWNQQQGDNSRTVMQNALTGAVAYEFPRGVIGCPVSAVELTPGVALCAFAFDNSKRTEGACITTDGRRVEGTLKISELCKTTAGEIVGGDSNGNLVRLDGLRWRPWASLGGGRIFKLRTDGRYLYATVDGPPRLCVVRDDGQWRELDRGSQQSYGQFGLNVAVGPASVYWTRQDESKTGALVELVKVPASMDLG